ncbi:ATP-dependent zinc protease [Pseudomonas sp. dw_358]|uniref:ATP-dependent zinc protease family protein n=1 Tax=Pseudomonas sp. dw_358 TaxID=2720083 RepID=UPI001BD36781|nr:ATP-dependent zinc protease [Pseudomonas sp. dw_358]
MNLKPYLTALCLCVLPGLCLAADKTVYGLSEHVRVSDLDLPVEAKLDTGASTASLSARDITRFRRHGQSWVRFRLAIDQAHQQSIERPLLRISHIKRRAGDTTGTEGKAATPRPVVALRVCIGRVSRVIEVNLTDRSAFQYPLLIGAQALKDFSAVVDPSLAFTAGQPACAPVEPE